MTYSDAVSNYVSPYAYEGRGITVTKAWDSLAAGAAVSFTNS